MKYNQLNILKSLEGDVSKSLDEKIEVSRKIIKETFDEFGDSAVIAWSGGKNSTILLKLALEAYPSARVVFSNTGVEFPETIRFIKRLKEEWNLNLTELTFYEKNFWKCVEDYGFPVGRTKKNSKGYRSLCCYYLKKRPMEIFIKQNKLMCILDGVTALESRYRMFVAAKFGSKCLIKRTKTWKVRPLLYWTSEDCWNYIKNNNIPYNPIYDRGVKRTGCLVCTSHHEFRKQIMMTYPKLLQIIFDRMDPRDLATVSQQKKLGECI